MGSASAKGNVGNERKGGAECTQNDEIRTKTRRNARYEDDEGRWRQTGAILRRKLVYSGGGNGTVNNIHEFE